MTAIPTSSPWSKNKPIPALVFASEISTPKFSTIEIVEAWLVAADSAEELGEKYWSEFSRSNAQFALFGGFQEFQIESEEWNVLPPSVTCDILNA